MLIFFDPSQGMPGEGSFFQVQAKNLDSFTANGTPMSFPPFGNNSITGWSVASSTVFGYNQQTWGGDIDYRTMLNQMQPGQTPGSLHWYPYFSQTFDLPYDPTAGKPSNPNQNNNQTFQFTGGNVTFNVLIPSSAGFTSGTGTVVQTINVNFPNGTFPTPYYAGVGTDSGYTNALTSNQMDIGTFGHRFAYLYNQSLVAAFDADPGAGCGSWGQGGNGCAVAGGSANNQFECNDQRRKTLFCLLYWQRAPELDPQPDGVAGDFRFTARLMDKWFRV